MKIKIMTLVGLLVIAGQATAQQPLTPPQKVHVTTKGDSIIILKGKGDMRIRVYEEQSEGTDNKEVEIYDGVYLEKTETDKHTFLDALPLIPRKYNAYDPHCTDVFIGYSRMADSFLSFGAADEAGLDISKSWEFGFNLLNFSHNFRKNPHWGINLGVCWGYRSFNIDGNRALVKENGHSYFVEGDEETSYSKSRLRHFFFRVPILAEWQQKTGRYTTFFNIGPEFEIRHSVKSFAHLNGGKKQTIGKGMYVQPVGVNILAQAGIGDIGIYLRYSTNSLFQKDKGPDVSPYSFGVAWYW